MSSNFVTIKDILRRPDVKATIDHRTPEDQVVTAFKKVFYNGSPWSLAIFDSHDGLLLMCDPDKNGISVAHNILKILPGMTTNGAFHVEQTAQVMAVILNIPPDFCKDAAEASQIIIQGIRTDAPSIKFWKAGKWY